MNTTTLFSTLMQFLWPMLSVATFVVCLQIRGRNRSADGVSLLVAGAGVIMFMSLTNTFFRVMMINRSIDFTSISGYFSITSLFNLVGQLLFLVGLYQFGMGRRADSYDDLLDDLPD